jgi:hypothetical protein
VWVKQLLGAKEPPAVARPSRVVERTGRRTQGRRLKLDRRMEFDRVQEQLMKDQMMKDFNWKVKYEMTSWKVRYLN